MKISFFTLGCKLNQAETDELKKELLKLGFFVVPFKEKSDVAVIRACGVTCGASQTTREMIRSAKRRGAYIMATGCLENKDLSEINFVAKNNAEIIKHLKTVVPYEAKGFLNTDDKGSFANAQDDKTTVPADRTRAFIKIQNGCNFNCTYCIIPSFRGRSASIPAAEILKKITQAERQGFQEIVLTGVNICQYREGKIDLSGLLKKILKKTKIPRIRLGSLDPRLISDELIKIYSHPRLLPHWHLSLQSGSDEVLKNMRRGYTTKQYGAIVKKLRALNPLFSLTTDIIVGFPGETDQQFQETCAFVRKIEFTKVHVFPFSSRPGTAAEKMPDQVQDKIKKERVKKLLAIANQTSKKFISKFIGLTRPVLFENNPDTKSARAGGLVRGKKNLWKGYSPEYFVVEIKSAKNLANKIKPVKISATNAKQDRQ